MYDFGHYCDSLSMIFCYLMDDELCFIFQAYKTSSPTTKSEVFSHKKEPSSNANKKANCKNLSLKSTVFDPAPELTISNKPRSKTYKCTLKNPCLAELFTQRRLSTKSYSQSAMKGSGCDVKTQDKPFIMSSDFIKTPLKSANSRPLTAPSVNSTEHLPSSSETDIISSSGNATVHHKCHDKKASVSNSYKSEGFRESIERNGKALPSRQTPTRYASSGNKNLQSQVFSPEKPNDAVNLWSSDFNRARFCPSRKNVRNNTVVSSVFLPPERNNRNKAYVSKTYQSSVFI